MNHHITIFCSLLILLVFTGCSNDDDAISPVVAEDQTVQAEVLKNLSYGSDAAQTYDIYLPANRSAATTKVLVFIHGGGWVQGDKSDMREYIPLLQEMHPDHAIVNMNYRLAQPPTIPAFPNQFLDLQQALRHIDEEAADLGFKAEFGLIGVSAGGHLALQYDNIYDLKDRVKMVCSIVGPTDLTDPFYTENPNFDLALGLLIDESAYPGVTDYAATVSPAYLVNENSSPTILFYGEEDPLVPVSNGTFMQQQLDSAGIINSLSIYEGGHGDWEDESNEAMQEQLSDFIDLHLAVED